MCGRYEAELRALPGIDRFADLIGDGGRELMDELASVRSRDVRPTNQMPLLLRDGPDAPWAVESMRWGLLPAWAKRKGLRPAINARGETVATKPYFRAAYQERRGVVVASAFFEWRAIEGQKRKEKLRFARADGLPLCMAALWEPAASPKKNEAGEGDELPSYAIITIDSGPDIVDIHDRQPVILDPAELESWFFEGEPTLLAPSPAGELIMSPDEER